MVIDKSKLVEKMREMTEEEKGLFQEAFKEVFPEKEKTDSVLSMEEVQAFREMLAGKNKKLPKGKSVLNTLFGGLE